MGGAPSTLLHAPPLVLGGADVLKPGSEWTLEGNNIAACVSVCDKTPRPQSGLEILHINLQDKPETQLSPTFSEAAAFIHTARCAGGAVYVHCTAGVSRSTTIATGKLPQAIRGRCL